MKKAPLMLLFFSGFIVNSFSMGRAVYDLERHSQKAEYQAAVHSKNWPRAQELNHAALNPTVTLLETPRPDLIETLCKAHQEEQLPATLQRLPEKDKDIAYPLMLAELRRIQREDAVICSPYTCSKLLAGVWAAKVVGDLGVIAPNMRVPLLLFANTLDTLPYFLRLPSVAVGAPGVIQLASFAISIKERAEQARKVQRAMAVAKAIQNVNNSPISPEDILLVD